MQVLFAFLTLIAACCISSVECYNILGVFPHSGKSHFEMYRPLMKGLAKKGHNITVVSFFPNNEVQSNYRDVTLDCSEPLVNIIDFDMIPDGWWGKQLSAVFLKYAATMVCDGLKSEVFQDFINGDQHFDLIIGEIFNTNCYHVPILKKFKAPMVGIISNYLMPWHSSWLGSLDNPSYIPNIFQGYTDHMSFWERLDNFIGLINHKLFYKYLMKAQDKRYIRDAFGIEDDPDELMKNLSLVLVTTHFTTMFPQPLIPNVIEVGGMHLGKVKPLPKDLEEWIAGSPGGVVYLSMGSLIKGHTFPEEKRQAFLRAFARLPQRVLWKYENETMPGKPANVMIRNWLPQVDVLCHPNVKAFISHGGNLGLTEAVHCGTPAIVMPQFGDQFLNAANLEKNGGGVVMNLRSVDEESIYNNLVKILEPSFQRQTKELSARFRDRPLPPLDTAIYWVEYVARHNGTHFMRTAAANMPLYQYLLLDVIAFLLLSALFFLFVLRFIYRFLCKRNPQSKPKTH